MSIQNYKQRITEIFTYLYEEYGVLIDETDTRISLMEINCTFKINDSFHKYHRALRLLMYLLPDYYKKITEVQKKNSNSVSLETETFYRGNKSMQIKIYDKKRQLEDTIGYEHKNNLLRIEFVLKTSQKIREVFHGNYLKDITDQKINDLYIKEFNRLFAKQYQTWRKENGAMLKALIEEYKKCYSIHWQRNLIQALRNKEQIDRVPVLLEIEDLLEQIKFLDNKGHYKRIERSIINKCLPDDVFLQKDSQKIEEIITKVNRIYSNFTN